MLQRLSDNIRECYLRADGAVGTPMRLPIPPGSNFISTWRGVGSFWPEAAHLRNSFPVS